MALQHWILLLLASAAAAYLARGMFRSSCASGCGGCKSKECPAKRLEAIRAKLEDSHSEI